MANKPTPRVNAPFGKGTQKAVRTGTAKAKSTGLWVKRDNSTGRFAQIKSTGGTFKGVKRER